MGIGGANNDHASGFRPVRVIARLAATPSILVRIGVEGGKAGVVSGWQRRDAPPVGIVAITAIRRSSHHGRADKPSTPEKRQHLFRPRLGRAPSAAPSGRRAVELAGSAGCAAACALAMVIDELDRRWFGRGSSFLVRDGEHPGQHDKAATLAIAHRIRLVVDEDDLFRRSPIASHAAQDEHVRIVATRQHQATTVV